MLDGRQRRDLLGRIHVVVQIEWFETPRCLGIFQRLLQHEEAIERPEPVIGISIFVAIDRIDLPFAADRSGNRRHEKDRGEFSVQAAVTTVHVAHASGTGRSNRCLVRRRITTPQVKLRLLASWGQRFGNAERALYFLGEIKRFLEVGTRQ